MTDPSTAAGRETHDLLHRLSSQMKTCEMVPCPFAGLARRTEAEARAEGRREAVDRVGLWAFDNAIYTKDRPDTIEVAALQAFLDEMVEGAVAGPNASEPRLCACGAPAEWPDGKCDKHHARRGLRDANEPAPDNWPKPLPAEEHRR